MSLRIITCSWVNAAADVMCAPITEATIWNALLTTVSFSSMLSLTDASGGLIRSGSDASNGSEAWSIATQG